MARYWIALIFSIFYFGLVIVTIKSLAAAILVALFAFFITIFTFGLLEAAHQGDEAVGKIRRTH